jgi:hypothetical protein
MPEWLVQLVGAERDLRFLATSLCNPDCRVTEDDGEFHLRSRRFEALAGASRLRLRLTKWSITRTSPLWFGSRAIGAFSPAQSLASDPMGHAIWPFSQV